LFQLVNKQSGINKVVNKMKNKDIPSIPIAKLKLRLGNHNNSLTNWKEAIDFSKKPHKNKEQLKDKHVEFRATIFNNLIL
jgi:hypothetical protein